MFNGVRASQINMLIFFSFFINDFAFYLLLHDCLLNNIHNLLCALFNEQKKYLPNSKELVVKHI